jgi:PAS domain S-box-containing protein
MSGFDCLTGGGEAGALLRAIDWSKTPLGPVQGWPLSLRAAVRIVLSSDFPMMLHWGSELTTIYNDAYAPSLGHKHPGHLGRPAQEWWSEMWEQLAPIFNKVLSGGTFHVENARYTPDRDGVPREAYFTHCHSPLWDDEGQIAGIFLVVTETTRQVLAEHDLTHANADLSRQAEVARESEARLGALVRATSEVLYSMSADWTEMRQLTGGGFLADTGTANPRWIEDYIPETDQPRVRAAIAEAVRSRSIFSLEHQVRLANGGLGWTQSRAVPLFGPDGRITEWFGTASDVTARREIEEARQRLNEILEKQVAERTTELTLYRNIVQSGEAPICAFDHMFRLIAFNQAHSDEFFRIFGHRVQLGEVFPDLFPPDQKAIIRGFMARALGGEAYAVTEEFGDPGLAKPCWEVSYAPLRDAGGEIIGAFHHARDISARLRAEAELTMTQEALRQSQKMEAVGQLTGGLAHDFNNLLTGVTGNLELMQTRIAQGSIKDLDRYVNAAQGAAKRAAGLTHRLLAFSRRQTLDPKPTDVNRLVLGMEDLIRRTVGPAIEVKLLVGTVGIWPTLVDPGQLESALLNLAINARDAMPDGGKLTIETGNRWLDERMARNRELPPGQYVSLCVSDTGTGMTPEVIEKAFDPFFTTKPIGQGTGLGLSMIYGFAKQSNGQVHISSEVGQGTTVCLYLPRHLGEAETAEWPPELVEAPRAEDGQTVLVVDDEPTVRMLVTEVLEELGYQAIKAEDGVAGLQVLQSDVRIDLLVTDVGLPGGMNGRQVADAARVLRPDLKVLFITGYAENAVLSHSFHLGMHILTKPFTMEVLARRIKDLIDTRKS